MIFVRLIFVLGTLALTGCLGTPNTDSSSAGTYNVAVGGAPPPPGRTDAERQARRDYYRGPRGDEF